MFFVKKIDKEKPLHYIGAAYINKFFWVSALEWNGYYKVNAKNGKTEFLGFFKYADFFADKLFNQVLSYKKYVFFIPWFSNYLVKLDTQTLDTKYWKLPKKIELEVAKFRTAVIYNEKIFMFPHYGDTICIFDIELEEFECNDTWLKKYLKNVNKNEKNKFIYCCQKGDCIWLSNLSGSFMMRFNLDNYESEMILFPDSEGKIIDVIKYDENNLLTLTSAGNVWKYKIDSSQKEIIYKYEGRLNNPYSRVLIGEKKIYLIPLNEKNIEEIFKNEKNVIVYPLNWELNYINVGMDMPFYGYYKDNNVFFLYPCEGNMLLKIDTETNELFGIMIYDDRVSREKRFFDCIEPEYISTKILKEPKTDLRLLFHVFERKKGKIWNVKYSGINGLQIWNIVNKI